MTNGTVIGEVLFEGSGNSSANKNQWFGWYNTGGTVELGDGKRPAYDNLPIVSLYFFHSSGAWADYALTGPYQGQTLLRTVQTCMGSDRENIGSLIWNRGHCEIGELRGSSGIQRISNVLRLGVGDGNNQPTPLRTQGLAQPLDWALFMLSPQNYYSAWEGYMYAIGVADKAHSAHSGHFGIAGVQGTSTTSTFTLPLPGEILFVGDGASGQHNYGWAGWYVPGGGIADGLGKRDAYDDLPISAVQFLDESGARADFLLNSTYSGQSLLRIVEQCTGGGYFVPSVPPDNGNHRVDEDLCVIGHLRSSSGIPHIANVLRLDVYSWSNYEQWDRALFMLESSHVMGDFAGNRAYAIGSESRAHAGYDGRFWITGTPGTSTTTTTTTFTLGVYEVMLFAGFGDSSFEHTNRWSGWYQPGDTVDSGFGKREAYDTLTLDALRFYDSSGSWAEYRLTGIYRGRSLLRMVQLCLGESPSFDCGTDSDSVLWRAGHCVIGELENSSGIANISRELRVGVGHGYEEGCCQECWVVFMLQMGFFGEHDPVTPYGIGYSSKAHTGHNGPFWISGLPGTPLPTDLTGTTVTTTVTLFQGSAGSFTHRNLWTGWYKAGDTVVDGDGKRIEYEDTPITSLHFGDSDGFEAVYQLYSPYQGLTLLQIVQRCLGEDFANQGTGSDGSAVWLRGHCQVGELSFLSTDWGIPSSLQMYSWASRRSISNVLRIGVGNRYNQDENRWTLFMLSNGVNYRVHLDSSGWQDVKYAWGSIDHTMTGGPPRWGRSAWISGGAPEDPDGGGLSADDTLGLLIGILVSVAAFLLAGIVCWIALRTRRNTSFQLQQVEQGNADWSLLQSMLVPPDETKDTMHVGRDVHRYHKRYSQLLLQRAWAIKIPSREKIYNAQKCKIQADLQALGGVNTSTLLDEASRRLGADTSCNEKFLLHGTKAMAVLGILRKGISDEYASTTVLFGRGSYCAEDPSKSNQYADADTPDHDNYTMRQLHQVLYSDFGVKHPGEVFYTFVCEVALGCPVHTTGKADGRGQLTSMPDPNSNSVDNNSAVAEIGIFRDPTTKRELADVPGQEFRFHCLIVEKGEDSALKRHREFIFFEDMNIIPRYLLAYSREE